MHPELMRLTMSGNWAIQPDAMDNIIAVLNSSAGIEALQQKPGTPVNGTLGVTVRDGVAVVKIVGPLTKYETFISWLFDRATYESLALDLRTVTDDPNVKAIVLSIDSPGGMVSGVSELAAQIRAISEVKPIVAHVGGVAASAAYWLASAASEIIASDVASIGSIGAIVGLSVYADSPQVKRYSFVSSISPNKVLDPGTAEGAKEYQRQADEVGSVFVETVARNRGTTVENVLENYGQGSVYTGAEALNRGMIDSIGTLESVIARFSQPDFLGAFMATNNTAGAAQHQAVTAEAIAAQHPDIAAALRADGAASVDAAKIAADARAEGIKAERDRIAGIEALAVAGAEDVVTACKADISCTVEQAAIKILTAVRAKPAAVAPAANPGAQHLDSLQATETNLDAPKGGSGSDKEPTAEEAAKDLVALARKAGIEA